MIEAESRLPAGAVTFSMLPAASPAESRQRRNNVKTQKKTSTVLEGPFPDDPPQAAKAKQKTLIMAIRNIRAVSFILITMTGIHLKNMQSKLGA
jgi:hypothetical protein